MKRNKFILLFYFLSVFIIAQTNNSKQLKINKDVNAERLYLNKFGEEVDFSEMPVKYRLITNNPDEDGGKIIRIYYISGKLLSEQFTRKEPVPDNPTKMRNTFYGNYQEWYENGKIKLQVKYQNNKYNGEFIVYWPNGQIKRVDMYNAGNVIKGTCYDSIGSKVRYYDYEIKPQFPGGISEMNKFIAKNLIYPVSAQEKGIQGNVKIQFTVMKDGKLSEIKIIKSPGEELDNEAKNLIYTMPLWNPCSIDGEIIESHYSLTLNFKLTSEHRISI